MPTTDAERVVHAFLTRMGPTPADVRKTVDGFLTDDCVWENPGSPVCRGKEEIFALLPADFARLEVRFRHMATAGDSVLAERIESMFRADGTPIALNLKVMAVFDLRAGRIAAWRDYYDHTHLISERPDW
ncbi:nuclear transport factor 2 family protein [Streptomyces sp. WAC 00631]|uniref:limonene-1,2-epoxide hydrolase family protein n=1 Tax=unclassified Streptomyces TaxID=2593676 RepID=UPI000F79D25E|nr:MULTISPECIES: limonene-1,2-epoxide hydrolase family protein [unclassified Streptomyces]MCC5033398.1 nuclear transport factor 2 family protein [Streptomyces sp. WAC 00631]MCC9741481.1 nuclear transport factor 2 family protein [Streptomyces sp. MNU89]